MIRLAMRGALLALSLVSLALGGCDPKTTRPEDTVPPEAEITSPADGATVSGLSFLLETTTNDDAIAVEVTVGSDAPFTIEGPPWETPILTIPFVDDEDVPVSIEAFDAAGNSTVRSITVTIRPRVYTQLTTAPQNDSHPSWSPDGTQIAFQSHRNGTTYDIWTMNDDGTNETRMTTNTNEDVNPAWSPDGTRIAWQTNRAGKYDVFWMTVAGGEATAQNLTFPNENNGEPAWSHDGSWLYFSTDRGGSYDIYRLNTSSLVPTLLTSYAAQETEPSANFDGTLFAFSSDLNLATPHIYLSQIGSADAVVVTGEPAVTEIDPNLSPLGGVLLYTRIQGTVSNIWAIYNDRGTAVQVTNGASILGDGGGVWSPDGDRIAFHSGVAGNLDIWIVE